MVQKIANFDKWRLLDEEAGVFFSNPMPRTVRLTVRSADKARLYVTDEEGQIHFLALVEGLDVVEFSPEGPFTLNATCDAEVLVFTADGDDVSFVNEAPESFTRVVERRKRNPELEAIVMALNRSNERRLNAQAAELEQLRHLAESANARSLQPSTTGVPASAGPSPGQANGNVTPKPQAAPAGPGSRDNVVQPVTSATQAADARGGGGGNGQPAVSEDAQVSGSTKPS